MIIVQIIGGLGNQMFQYAFGRRLADGLAVPLKLDISAFGSFYDKRPYTLGALRIEESKRNPSSRTRRPEPGGSEGSTRRNLLRAAGNRP